MTAPVPPASSAIRASRPSSTDGDPNSGAPFASALDGALNAGRDDDGPAAARRSPRSQQRPDVGGDRPRGHDGGTVRQASGTRAHGSGDPGAQGFRRVEEHEPDRTPSDAARADKDAVPAADDVTTAVPPSVDVVNAGVAVALSSAIPTAWAPPPVPDAPATPAPSADPAGGIVAGAPGERVIGLDASLPGAGTAVASPQTQNRDAVPFSLSTGPTVAPGTPAPAGAEGGAVPAAPPRPGTLRIDNGVPVAAASGDRLPAAAAPADAAPAAAPPVESPAVPGLPAAAAASRALVGSVADARTEPAAPSPPAAAHSAGPLPDVNSAAIASPHGSADAPAADAGDPSRQEPGAAAPDPSASVVAAPLGPARAVAPVAASATAAATPHPVATQVASQVAVLSNGPDGTHSVTVVLHPDSLGPVQVQVTLSQGTVDLTMRGAHEHGRAALLDALPDLRRDLEAAGLTCSKLDVDRNTGGSWSAQHQSSQHQSSQQQAAHQQWAEQGRRHQDWSDGRFRPWSRTADSGDGRPAPAPIRSTSRGVDVRV